jgi:excisionase family DNA binding protein
MDLWGYGMPWGEPKDETKEEESLGMTVLTIPEVAKLLRVTPKVVREQCARGCIPARKIGGSWRIEQSTLMRWFQDQEAACPSFGVEKYGGSISLPPAPVSGLDDLLERTRKNLRKSSTTAPKRNSGSNRS